MATTIPASGTIADVKNKTDQLFTCLEEIKVAAVNILKKLEPVMKNIKDANHEVVLQGTKKHPEYSVLAFQEAMSAVATEWIKDASAVKLEIDGFIKLSDDGLPYIVFISCPFLTEVWNGDAYDKQGLDGLKALKADLLKQFNDINRENLFVLAAKKIKDVSD
jgi:hypothetical protein